MKFLLIFIILVLAKEAKEEESKSTFIDFTTIPHLED